MADDCVDVMTFKIAVAMVDEGGKDPAWVRMVVAAKGFGDIDIDHARIWLAANPNGCPCQRCAAQAAHWRAVYARQRDEVRRIRPKQLDLFG